MMLLINMKLNYFGGYNAGKTKRSNFWAKKKLTKKSRRPRHGCFGVTTSLIINLMQPFVYQTKADDLPQRMMWVELYLMGDNTVGSPL